MNIDDTDDGRRSVRTALLAAEIPIAERLRGPDLPPPDRGARFFAAPIELKGLGTFPFGAFGIA